jgi:MFS family permease
MGFLGVFLGAVFVQSGALVAEFSPKGKESLNMAFFNSVIDFSFPVMPLIVTYLATFGLKTPFLMSTSLVALSSLTFLAWRK